MDSTLLDLGIVKIKWYSLFILIAIFTAYFIIKKESQKKKIPPDFIMNLFFYGVLIGIVGARFYYVIFNISYYLKNPKEILMIWNGGIAIHGAIIATLIFLIIYSKKNNIKTLLMTDIIAVGLILAQAIGRWGNFFNQEAYGRIVSLQILKNMHLPKYIIDGMYIDGLYREPTFLYESILSFIGFIILIIIRKNPKLRIGQITSIYLLWYGIERLIIETFRSDSLMLGNLKIAQVVSIIAIISGIYLLIKSKNNKLYIKEKVGE